MRRGGTLLNLRTSQHVFDFFIFCKNQSCSGISAKEILFWNLWEPGQSRKEALCPEPLFMRKFAWLSPISKSLHNFAWLSSTLHDFPQLCTTFHDFARLSTAGSPISIQFAGCAMKTFGNLWEPSEQILGVLPLYPLPLYLFTRKNYRKRRKSSKETRVGVRRRTRSENPG